MNKCTQCEKTAIQQYGDNFLCLDCLEKLSLIHHRENEQRHREIMYNMQMANSAEQYMNEVLGGGGKPSFDLQAFYASRNIKSNTVNVNNSIVGNISTEEVGNIQVSLEKINQSGGVEIAQKLHELASAVLSAPNVRNEKKNELLEQLSLLSEQASLPIQNRKTGLIKAASNALKESASTITSIPGAWEKIEPIIKQLTSST